MHHNSSSSQAQPTVDPELISRINRALIESGDRERLKQLVKNRLEESGWFAKMREEADSI